MPELQVVDQEFEVHVAHFESIYAVKIKPSIMFADLDTDVEYAFCYSYSPNHRLNVIYVDRTWWSNADFYAREELLFHELGHCVFALKHKDQLMGLGDYKNAPSSIMYSMPFGEFSVYRENLDYYYNELNEQRGR